MSTSLLNPQKLTQDLLDWYGRAGRSFPWRETRDPYRIWLSEIMLQQTGVVAVQPYYARFLQRFPTVEALAEAAVEEVTELWAGLGYYNRARNLHAAARQIVTQHQGRLPQTLEELQDLPGVGRSTAGAILSIAYDIPAAILDGNVRRVLCRLYALQADPRSTASEKKLWAWSEGLVSQDRPHDFTQAIMDLGATLCIPRSPRCDECPLEPHCQARQQGLERELPQKRIKKKVPTRQQVALVIERNTRVFVRRRPADGMLAGLWEFPAAEVPAKQITDRTAEDLLQGLDLVGELVPLGLVRHAYSHFKLELHLYHVRVEQSPKEPAEHRWCSKDALKQLALHGAAQKALPLFMDVIE